MAKPREHLAATGLPPEMTLVWEYTDEHLAVCVKPRGVAVQGDASANKLKHAAAWALPPPAGLPDTYSSPHFAHRIDKATGGLLVWARTRSAAGAISKAFAREEDALGAVRKTYLAIVCGRLEGSGLIDAPISGKSAQSGWEALSCVKSAKSGYLTTLKLRPVTGRYHQLRRHLALELGCPILGDPRYLSTEARSSELEGDLHLWALEIELPHPATGEPLHVATTEPPHFEERRKMEEAAAAEANEAEWNEAVAHAEERKRRAAAGEYRHPTATAGNKDAAPSTSAE